MPPKASKSRKKLPTLPTATHKIMRNVKGKADVRFYIEAVVSIAFTVPNDPKELPQPRYVIKWFGFGENLNTLTVSDEILEHNEELVDAFLTNVMEVGHIDEDSIPDSIQDKVAAIYNHFLRNREPGDIILASCSVGHEEEQRDQLYKEYEKLDPARNNEYLIYDPLQGVKDIDPIFYQSDPRGPIIELTADQADLYMSELEGVRDEIRDQVKGFKRTARRTMPV